MARYWRGDITLRKLRVLAEGLPDVGPHTRHHTNGHEYGTTDSMLWMAIWAIWVNTVTTAQAAGDKKAKMPSEEMPPYPWVKPQADHDFGGDLGDHSQEEVKGFLDSMF